MDPRYYFNISDEILNEYKERYGHEMDADIVRYCKNHNEENKRREEINRQRIENYNRAQLQNNSPVMQMIARPQEEELDEIIKNHPELRQLTRSQKADALGIAFHEILDARGLTANKAYEDIFIDSSIKKSSFNNYVGPGSRETERKKKDIIGIGLGLRVTNEEMEKLLTSYGYQYEYTGFDGLARQFCDKELPAKEVQRILEILKLNPTEEEAVMFED